MVIQIVNSVWKYCVSDEMNYDLCGIGEDVLSLDAPVLELHVFSECPLKGGRS